MKHLHPVTLGAFTCAGNLFLAPVAGWTDAAFRFICAREGADFTFTELVSAESVFRGVSFKRPGKDYILRNTPDFSIAENAAASTAAPAGKPYGIQLFGSCPQTCAAAVERLAPYKPAVIDLNAGCPVPKVTRTGAGSALMKNPPLLARIVESLRHASEQFLGGIPVSVKLRSGWDNASVNYLECALRAQDAGAALISLHPRTRAQGYGGKSDWTQLARLKQALSVPLAGSGDLYTPEDALRMFAETGCDGLMFARGAMGNPFIFRMTKSLLETGRYDEPSAAEKLNAAFEHLTLMAAAIGEKTACLEMRKIFCAYTKGLRGGAELRCRLTHANTIDDYRRILLPAG
ncbi:MAG: tRNA-dihydrouridine synthase [Spirochaetaceae bacterium]|nr:tRNA-dihydrouridine synthase [Spirochaetaceae bacterium]